MKQWVVVCKDHGLIGEVDHAQDGFMETGRHAQELGCLNMWIQSMDNFLEGLRNSEAMERVRKDLHGKFSKESEF